VATKKEVRDLIDRRSAANERNIVPVLTAPPNNASPAALNELKAERFTQYQSFRIALHFPNFYRWLASIRPGTSGNTLMSGSFPDLQTAVNIFITERNAYINPKGPVAAQLDAIMSLASGRALMAEIDREADVHAVHITPDLIFRLTGTPSADADIIHIDTIKNVTAVGMPILDPDRSKPWQGVRDDAGNFVGGGMGTRIDPATGKNIHGDDVFVEFSPDAFTRGGASRPAGPGMDPDDVLFHELVHATRQLAGVVYFMPVNQNYDNEEEYLAIVLSNIYIRNKRRDNPLRGDHDSGILRDPDHFLDNVQRVDLEPRMLLERFRLHQALFFKDLADIDFSITSFNPVKQYDDELKSGRAFAGQKRP
jgi:Effector protein